MRVWKLGEVPVSLYWDEIAMLADARSISATGKDMSSNPWLQPIYPSYGDYKLAPFIIVSSLFTKLPVSPEIQIRGASVIVGILTMIVSAVLAFELFKPLSKRRRKSIALAVLITVGFSPWAVSFSRTGFEGHLAQLFLASSVLFLVLARHRWYFYVLSGLLGCLTVLTYYAALYVWPVVIITTLLYIWLVEPKKSHQDRRSLFYRAGEIILLGAVFAVGLVVLTSSPFFNDMQRIRLGASSLLDPVPFVAESRSMRSAAENTLQAKLLYSAKYFQLKQAAVQFSSNISPTFLFISGDHNLRHSMGYGGLFALACLPALLLGIYSSFRSNKPTLLLLTIWWLVSLVPASIPTEVPHALRSLNALVPLSILIGFGWASLYERKGMVSKILLAVLLTFFVIQSVAFAYHYFNVYPKMSSNHWQDGYSQVVEYAVANTPPSTQLWIDHPDRMFLWYLVYANVPADTVQAAFKKSQFQPTSFGSVQFSGTLPPLDTTTPIALVTSKTKLAELLHNSVATPSSTLQIPTTFGESEMVLAIFNNDGTK